MSDKLYLKPVILNDGNPMPQIGYGTYKVHGDSLIEKVMDCALAIGYRLFDTAAVYNNEESIGQALPKLLSKHKLKREDIFITSKLPPTTGGDKTKILNIIQSSLSKLQIKYLDLYLIHWPGQDGKVAHAKDNYEVRSQTWKSLVEARERGWIKSIGVSNYSILHLSELIATPFGVLPAVNQIEWHPYCHQRDMKQLCNEHGILIQAYFSFGGSGNATLLQDPAVIQIAKGLSISPAKVLLSWALQQGIAIIPKSLKEDHIRENLDYTVKLSENNLALLNSLQQTRFGGDPRVVL